MARNKRKILESARKQVQKGAKDKALREYEKLLKLDPRDAKLRLEIGDVYRRWGQLPEAITAYSKVAEQYMDEGFDARAVAVFKQIQNLDSGRWASYVPLAELYQRMGLTSEAIQSLQTAVDGLYKEGRKHDALDLLRKMASLDPSNTTSRIKVADLLHQENLSQDAIAEYESAHAELDRQGSTEAAGTVLERILEIEPERPSTLDLLGRNFLSRGLAEPAEPLAKRALEAEPDEPAHFELLADVYRAQGRDDQLADTYRGLADLYRRRGDEDRAREIIQRFVPPEHIGAARDVEVTAPSEAETGSGAGPSLLDDDPLGADELPEAVESSETAPPPSQAEVTVSDAAAAPLADEEIALDTPTSARALDDELEEMLEQGPEFEGDPEQQLAEASVYLRYGKRPQALRHLNAILGQEPDHRGALEMLGDAHADAGDSDAAVGAWLRAGELARAEGDDETLTVLRDRVAAHDPAAASALGALAPKNDDGVEEILEFSDPGGPDGDSDSDTEDEAFDEDDIEVEIDDDLASDLGREALDLDSEDSEPEEDLAEETPAPVTDAAEEAEPSLSEAAAELSMTLGSVASTSAAAAKRVSEDLEEAEFYRKQGLRDEAEAVYQRVLEVAPNHPLALVRMGEISAECGEGPSEPVTDELRVEPGVAAAPVEDLDEVVFEAEDESGAVGDIAAVPPEADLGVGKRDATGPLADESMSEMDAAELALDDADDGDAEAGDSFDLAAELSDVLDEGSESSRSSSASGRLGSAEEQDAFSAVFAAFKKGVDETLDAADYEAHYDLGIAYREMELLEDAIGEFETASQCPDRRLACLHMLGLCALDLGRAGEAVGHLEGALGSGEIEGEQAMALRFDLGRAFEAEGWLEEARAAWREVAAVDPSFCGVRERLAVLGEEKPEEEPDAGDDDMESFDDLIAEVNAVSAGETLAESEPEVIESEPKASRAPTDEETPPAKKQRRKKKISFV